jgi:large subunit ribosomal protein L32e
MSEGKEAKKATKAVQGAIKLRRKQKRKKPSFQRQEGYRLKKLKSQSTSKWRRPKGRHSKLRQKEKARGKHPSPGYGSPREAKGLGRSGLKEIMIANPSQIKDTDPKTEAILISGTVGKAKREKILDSAKRHGIKVVNA